MRLSGVSYITIKLEHSWNEWENAHIVLTKHTVVVMGLISRTHGTSQTIGKFFPFQTRVGDDRPFAALSLHTPFAISLH